MLLLVSHATTYHFAIPVAHGLQRLRLTPKSTQGQRVVEWDMDFANAALEVEYDDHNMNRVALVSVAPGSSEVTIACRGIVATSDQAGIIGQHSGNMPLWAFRAQTAFTRPGPKMRALVSRLDLPAGDALASLHRLSAVIREEIEYIPGETEVDTTGEEAAALGRGVCQDHTHVFCGGARALGVPTRYVSGYLMMDDRIEQDAGHAWAEAHVAGLGWVGFDVSNGISPDARYVRVATGRDYREAAPITGMSIGGGETRLSVALAVEQQLPEQ